MPKNFKPDLRRENDRSLAWKRVAPMTNGVFFALGLLSVSRCFSAVAPVVQLPNFTFPPLRAELKMEAEKLGWSLDFSSGPASRNTAQKGDEVIGLVSLEKGEELQQWLVQIAVADLTEAEKKLPAKAPVQFYTSTGHLLIFSTARAALKTRIVGPWKFADAKSPSNGKDVQDRSHRVVTNDDYLAEGFDHAAAATLIMRQIMTARGEQRPPVEFSPKPYDSMVVEQARPIALAGGLTEENEHAYMGAQLVLSEFLRIIIGTPGMADVLKSVADVPWMSALGSGGKLKPTFNLLGLYVQKVAADPSIRPLHKSTSFLFS